MDAGVVVELLAGGLDPGLLGDEELAAPHLIDNEVMHALRGLVRPSMLTGEEGSIAMEGFSSLRITRFPGDWLRSRMWALRHNLSGYDATYVALAEATAAPVLLTTDVRLAERPASNAGSSCWPDTQALLPGRDSRDLLRGDAAYSTSGPCRTDVENSTAGVSDRRWS
ncbi:type II toxin-antitoxin system VapC family toxin [Arthrobacter echini]|uniref:type II toxin-antitoxin system VapC family toxin n=1 Tax=Arthrobacter echini TaxID=1529066 RepID=UPI001B3B8EFF|nr:type II toxin-antitoxin system VapC family toxin [Arthrobacter echini]